MFKKWSYSYQDWKESLKIAPPLSISHSALKEGIEIKNSIKTVSIKISYAKVNNITYRVLKNLVHLTIKLLKCIVKK